MRVIYNLRVDTRSVKKHDTVINLSKGECLQLDCIIAQEDVAKDLTDSEISLKCLLYKENGDKCFINQEYDELENGNRLINIVDAKAGHVIINSNHSFASNVGRGFIEIHIYNTVDGCTMITQRIAVNIVDSFVGLEATEFVDDNYVTAERLDTVIKQYDELYNVLVNLIEGIDVKHVHTNNTVLSKLSEVSGEVAYDNVVLARKVDIEKLQQQIDIISRT